MAYKTIFSLLLLISLLFISRAGFEEDDKTKNNMRQGTQDDETEIKYFQTRSDINIILFGYGNRLQVFGGIRSGKWVSSSQVISLIDHESTFRIFDNKKYIGTFNPASELLYDEYCDCPELEFKGDFEGKTFYIGVTGKWNIYPVNYRYSESDESHYKIIRDYLKKYNINEPVVGENNVDITKVDFDNDGDYEYFIEAENIISNDRNPSLKGSYSLILLVKDNKVIPVFENIKTEDATDEMDILTGSKIIALCDLNGDKVMELIISSEYYEGGGESILTFEQGRFISHLGCICGT